MEANIDSDHREAMVDAEKDLPSEQDTTTALSSTPVDENPMPITLSDIIASQKTEYFRQTVFTTMGHVNSFFFDGEDGVPRRLHP